MKEIKRLEVLGQVKDKVVTQREACTRLGMTDRHMRRLMRRYEEEGASGLVSKRRGKPSNRRIKEGEREAILRRVSERYSDFGPTLASEYLKSDGYSISKETLRLWLIQEGLWKPEKGRRKKLHPPRPRRSRVGELVQIDGSPHDWFEGRGRCCTLIAFIDDATSRVMYGRFVPLESTQAYLDGIHRYISVYGCPAAYYSDRHGIFTKHDPEDDVPTQYQRALHSLGIAFIHALTPQAKGRVERLFTTLQDRLVKALRLADISDIEAANAALPELLAAHNDRFAVPPESMEDAHHPFEGSEEELARICAIHETRKLSKELVLTYRGQRYIIQTKGEPRYSLRRATVTVVVHSNKRIELLHGKEALPFKVFDEEKPALQPADEKTLNAQVDEVLTKRRASTSSRPSANHPWRQYKNRYPADAVQSG